MKKIWKKFGLGGKVDQEPIDESEMGRLTFEMKQLNRLYRSPWYAFRNGILVGLGSAIGATILLSLLIHALKPFSIFSQITKELQQISSHDGNKR